MKKQLMNKVIGIVMLLPSVLLAESEVIDDVTWDYKLTWDGDVRVAEVTDCSPCSGQITIPKTLEGCPVTSIGASAFSYCHDLTGVLVPSSVRSVGYRAFYRCSKLMNVEFQIGVLTIGTSAFEGCSSLSNVIFPIGLRTILDTAFKDCKALSSLDLPIGLSKIGASAFEGCSGLLTASVPVGVKEIPGGLFYGCTSLKSVSLPVGLTKIGSSAFENCSGLIDCSIPKSVDSIGRNCFSGTTILLNHPLGIVISDGWLLGVNGACVKSVSLPASCAHMSDGALGSSGVEQVIIPNNWTHLPAGAFANCNQLKQVELPQTLVVIGAHAFEWCSSLASIDIPESVNTFEIEEFGYVTFAFCSSLQCVTFYGPPPKNIERAFANNSAQKIRYNKRYAMEWTEVIEKFSFANTESFEPEKPAADEQSLVLTVTNMVVSYVLHSVQPELAIPATDDRGFVNIITEVKGGCVAVPATWSVNYPKFTEKFGTDFTKALAMQTGKKDGAGNPMFVWQDYVAGTDPTKEDDVFAASITIVDGKVVISYTPELDEARKAMRKYTTWGKKSLMDTEWTEVQQGSEAEFNFFKVSVEMR